ncbi:MAG TPA: 30S ribosome-binding factor RbfA [Polyangiaceae bacterium LLY-WYZ-15_(1-7)]|nr:30S ribosome-binding factor RbfA [Polyangiaceae bacterium LLY-WYZ-15_(1-7)]HJL09567.1 30S ribosome-binding factor RbfA [Polyangiaceae bacterium LLY-WYZ-15_(1-7)]HJL37340.1 30S ribosome-binding factor RbfA [Polyangiaceae bacterium LLY-WYZ-15_(1-7)]HJL50560.1 30S ribosome-binding factor RbfA [Polyangiaceae bacterium LLY-WYZ-15_(1-7)]
MSEPRRADRVAERLRAELSELLLRGRVRDPGAKDVVVSAVRVTDDLSLARVYVRVLQEADARRKQRVVAALTRASGFLRRELAAKLKLRRAVDLEFFWDEQVDRVERLERIFDELSEERDAQDAPEEEEAAHEP